MRPISRREFDRALASNEPVAVERIEPARIAGADGVRREEQGEVRDLIAGNGPAPRADRIERAVQMYESLAPASGKHASIATYLAVFRAREEGRARPRDVPASIWNALPALEKHGISAADAERFMATGELPQLEELEKAGVERGSWTAVNCFTLLIGMRRSALAAERQAIAAKRAEVDPAMQAEIDGALETSEQIDRGLRRYANTIYAQASAAREQQGRNLIASAKAKMDQAAGARAKGDAAGAEKLEAKAQELRDRGARIAHAEAEYRSKIPRYDAASTYHLAADAQIDTGAAKVAAMQRGDAALDEEAPPELTGAETTANGVPGAERLLSAAANADPRAARSHAHLALERARQNALGNFHDVHVQKAGVERAAGHRQAYFDTRAAEIRLIGERLAIYGDADLTAADHLQAGQLAADRAAIIQELDGAIAVSAETDALVADQERAATHLREAVRGSADGVREAEARDAEQRKMSADAKEATEAWFGDTFKDSDEERRDGQADVDADAAQRITALQVGVSRAQHAELSERSAAASDRLKELEAQQSRDAADAQRARRSLSAVTIDPRRDADASARLSASHLDRAEPGVEASGARLSLARYWIRSTESDARLNKRAGATDRLDTAAGLTEAADAHRTELAPALISTRASLASAYADHRPAASRKQLEQAEATLAAIEDPALLSHARADIGAGAANSLVRHNLRFVEVAEAGHHDDTADDYFYRTAKREQAMEQVDSALDRVEEIFDITRDQIDNGEQLAGAQAGAISRAEITAAQATMSSVITGPVWLLTAGHVDMKGEVGNSFEEGAGSHRRQVKEHSDRMRQGASDLAAGFRSARENGEAFRYLNSIRMMSVDWNDIRDPSFREAKHRAVDFIRDHVPTGSEAMAPWSAWTAHALVDRGNPNALARAFNGSVLFYRDALELYGDRKMAHLDDSMTGMLDARRESIESTTDGMGWLIAINTAGEVGLGIVLTGGLGSAASVAKGGQALNSARIGIQAANTAKNISALARVSRSLQQFQRSHAVLHAMGVAGTVGTGMAAANHAVSRAAGRNTGVARGFAAFTSFIPFGAANRAIGIGSLGKQLAFGSGQAAFASWAVPAASEKLGLERSELGQAAIGVALNVVTAGGAAGAMQIAARGAPHAATPEFVASCPKKHPKVWSAISRLRGAEAEAIKGRALLAAERSEVCRRTMEEHGPIAARLIGELGEEAYLRAFGEAAPPRDLLKLGPSQVADLIQCCRTRQAAVRALIDQIASSPNPRALIEAARRNVSVAIELAANKSAGVEIKTRSMSAEERAALHRRSPSAPKDAVVVGAGPAGLLTALTLARRGVQVTVVEQREGYTRPVNLGVRMQMLDAIAKIDPDVVRDVLAVSAPIAQKEAIEPAGDHHVSQVPIPRRPDAKLFSPGARAMLRDKSTHVVRLSDLETVLHHRLEQMQATDLANGRPPRVRFLHNHQADLTDAGDGRYRVAVEGIETQRSEGKAARVRNGRRLDLGTPDLVFIAEGAGSATRRALKVSNQQLPEASRFISGYVDLPMTASMSDGTPGARSRYRTTQYFDPDEGVVNLRQIAGGNPVHGRTWVLVEVPPSRVFANPVDVEAYYREQAQLVMGVSRDEASKMSIDFGPNLFRMQQAISEQAVVGQNVFLIGDAVGNGHFLVGGGTNVLGVPHLDAVDRLDVDLTNGINPAIARDRYNKRVLGATKAWLDEGRQYFAFPTPDEYTPQIHGQVSARQGRSLNVYGEGEAQSFMDVATDGYYANGRPMTDDLPARSAPEIFIRSAPINARTLREIERLIAPGGRVTLLQAAEGSQARMLLDHFAGKAELIQDSVVARTDELGSVDMRVTQLRFPKIASEAEE